MSHFTVNNELCVYIYIYMGNNTVALFVKMDEVTALILLLLKIILSLFSKQIGAILINESPEKT